MVRFLIGLLLAAGPLALPLPGQSGPRIDPRLEQLVQAYIGLYSRDSFDIWTRLFRPEFTATSTNADGSVTSRSLDQFLEAQRSGFRRAKEMREELVNVRIDQRDRLASVWADFVFHYDGVASRGKLVLLAVSDTLGWRFSSLVFAYDPKP
jgi:arginyl-tRNA--protein-N-Asp/Glu arginylyltransferase